MSYYCRLCYSLWTRGGQVARFLTTFHAAVYNLVLTLAGADKRPPLFPCQRIRRKNKKFFKADTTALNFADMMVLGFAVKLNDDKSDGDKGRAFVLKSLFGRLVKRTVKNHVELYEKSVDAIKRMDELQSGGAALQDVLDAYGKAMSCAFEYTFALDEKYLHAIEVIAQWTFFVDMLDDYDDDVKKHAVNTLVRDGCNTLAELFDKHYNELIITIQNLQRALCDGIDAIKSDATEWIVLHKIIGHSVATLVPNILNGEDVKFHYFRDTYLNRKKNSENKKIVRKFAEK